jgi:biopolymer transport protein ExbB
MKSTDLYSNGRLSSFVQAGGVARTLVMATAFGICLLPAASFAQTSTANTAKAPEAVSHTAPAPSASAPAVPATTAPAPVEAAAIPAPAAATEHAPAGGGLAGHDLSPWGMYQAADIVVKGVMIGLLLASIATWTIWLAKTIELSRAKRRLRRELVELKGVRTLNQAADQARDRNSFVTLLVEDAQDELRLSSHIRETDGIKERVSFRMERLVAACAAR